MRFRVILFLIFGSIGLLQSQVIDSLLFIPEVEISERLESHKIGNDLRNMVTMPFSPMPEIALGQNLANLVYTDPAIQVRLYSPGGLASMSIQGLASHHNVILWNGFPIPNPMVASLDASVLNISPRENVKIVKGAFPSIGGSGAMGGTIFINQKPKLEVEHPISFGVAVGSFGLIKSNIENEWGSKKIRGNIQAQFSSSKNNFPYSNSSLPNNPIENRINADISNIQISAQEYIPLFSKKKGDIHNGKWGGLLNQNSKLFLFHHWNRSNRNIPPPINTSNFEEKQFDQSIRNAISFETKNGIGNWNLNIGSFLDELNYSSKLIPFSNSSTHTGILELGWNLVNQKKWGWNFSNQNFNERVWTNNYLNTKIRNRNALQFGFSKSIRNFRSQLNFRHEWVDAKSTPITGQLGMEWQLKNENKIFGTVSRSYRLPGLNDLYWAQGGNPNLLPENGIHVQTGYNAMFYSNAGNKLTGTFTIFQHRINNWIQWLPTPGSTLFSPLNIKTVHSTGGESNFRSVQNYRNFVFISNVAYSYARVVNQSVDSENLKNSVGKLLIYTPLHNFRSQINIAWKKYQIGGKWQYTSKRYTTTENNPDEILDGFSLVDLELGKEWKINGNIIVVNFHANNIFNISYAQIANRPLPGINFMGGISYTFAKNSSQ
jgi:vitamin B12 transporter